MDVATGKREKVRVFGNDYATVDGSGVRDYIDVNDLAEAHVKAVNWLFGSALQKDNPVQDDSSTQNRGIFEPINIGTGRGTSVLEMIQLVSEVVGKPVSYEIVPRRSGDIGEAVACVTKAREILGWAAKKSVKESIVSAFEFAQGIK